jgi:hypothetical protein
VRLSEIVIRAGQSEGIRHVVDRNALVSDTTIQTQSPAFFILGNSLVFVVEGSPYSWFKFALYFMYAIVNFRSTLLGFMR